LPDSYQRLLLDAMSGDASLFARSDEVETAWSIIDPILAAWQSPAAPPMETYPRGDWGPPSSSDWMHAQGREWFDVCPVLH
jgi:glucose-6-phosphate 1-dehydrogenase